MTTERTITINSERRPLGLYTWIATLRDGTKFIEFETDKPQLSFDVVAYRDDVAHVVLLPINTGMAHRIHIIVAPGERVAKKWVRTFQLNLDTNEQSEHPVVDSFQLITDKPIYHHCTVDGHIIVTTNPEP